MRLSPGILIAEVRIRRKAITAYEQDARDRGRRCPDAEIRRRHGEHGRAHKGDGRVARQQDHGHPGRRGMRGRQPAPYIWLDATCIKSRSEGRAQSTAPATVTYQVQRNVRIFITSSCYFASNAQGAYQLLQQRPRSHHHRLYSQRRKLPQPAGSLPATRKSCRLRAPQ